MPGATAPRGPVPRAASAFFSFRLQSWSIVLPENHCVAEDGFSKSTRTLRDDAALLPIRRRGTATTAVARQSLHACGRQARVRAPAHAAPDAQPFLLRPYRS